VARHQFTPTTYHLTLGSHAPALRVADGDTVETSTIDGAGADREGNQVVSGGYNAQTGPFYVEGAEPGDTLAVRLEHLWPNRAFAHSGTAVTANTVDPDFIAELPARYTRASWEIDLARGVAVLASPETALGRLELKIEPMLGCLGVAPPRGQAISASTASTHGGNMDYRGYVAGVTAYFPVFVPGALFSLGDGHAVQGDGELVGTGVEVSLDVRFTVRVLKNKPSRWPRAENDEYLMTLGNARPLDQALQHATTEMLRWLRADYGLDVVAASSLLGQCGRYEVGNVIDPAYTMVCKIGKSWLRGRSG
jgi:acetamidase/formamidase